MNRRFIRLTLALTAGVTALSMISCGSDSTASDPTEPQTPEGPAVVRAGDIFTLDSIEASGWKKSKQLSAEELPGAVEVWYGFFEQKDIEVRFYASHDDVMTLGIEPANWAIGRTPQSAEAGGKLGQGTARLGYDAYVIVGNTVMMCELNIATCDALISQLK